MPKRTQLQDKVKGAKRRHHANSMAAITLIANHGNRLSLYFHLPDTLSHKINEIPKQEEEGKCDYFVKASPHLKLIHLRFLLSTTYS